MVKIVYTQPDGAEKVIESDAMGLSLMELGRQNGVKGILGDCNGGADCGTCHVYVDPDWQDVVGAADAIESQTLELCSGGLSPSSRLSCQIKLHARFDGLRLQVADN